jgi:L-ascorbate metabolism protein UlaG (beta-lactamase superfamily)
MEITRLSRASWFKIKTDDKVIYFDPGYTGYFKNQGIPHGAIEDKADLTLISHFHKDHLQPEALEMITTEDTLILAPGSCTGRIKHPFICVKPGEELSAAKINIKVVDAYNMQHSHSTRKVHHKGISVGYVVSLKSKTIYFAGDTDCIPEMANLGKIDIAFLPIGGTFVMDIEEAINAALLINPGMVIPMHQSNYDPNSFKQELLSRSRIGVTVLDVGEKVTLK